jgi:hypothetical protein
MYRMHCMPRAHGCEGAAMYKMEKKRGKRKSKKGGRVKIQYCIFTLPPVLLFFVLPFA